MSALLIRSIVACGMTGTLLAGGWFTAVGLTLAPHTQPDTRPFVANTDGHAYHDPAAHCVYFNPRKPVLKFEGQDQAERFAHACPSCLKELARRSPQALAARPQ